MDQQFLPPTDNQRRYLRRLRTELGIKEFIEWKVSNRGEAGEWIRRLINLRQNKPDVQKKQLKSNERRAAIHE